MLEDWGEMFQLQLVLGGQYMLQSGVAMLHSVTALHKILRYTKNLMTKMVFLPPILANKSSKVSMPICVMDSLCHFLLIKYG